MADIRINALPTAVSPTPTLNVPVDGTITEKVTIQTLVETGRPVATQAEAEAGTNPSKSMSPLTTKQAIAAQVSAAGMSGNYNDLNDLPTLGGAAALNVGMIAGTVAAGDDPRFGASDLGATIHAAIEKTTLADDDEFGLADSAATFGTKKVTLANLIASIFTTTRKIANVVVDATNFKIRNAGGFDLTFSTTALTANRAITMANSDVDLNNVPVVITSAQQNFTFSTLITWAHGLGSKPSGVVAKLVNVTANAGYAVGDEIYLSSYWTTSGATSGIVIGADATSVFANVPAGYSVFAKGTFGNTNLTAASWKLVFEARK